jgi:hypothetical protein
MFKNFLPPSENLAICEIKWKNKVETNRPQMTIWRMRVACCITRAQNGNTQSIRKACWPLLPMFAGSNPAEAVGFFGRKNPQHAFLRRESKAVCHMSQLCGM